MKRIKFHIGWVFGALALHFWPLLEAKMPYWVVFVLCVAFACIGSAIAERVGK